MRLIGMAGVMVLAGMLAACGGGRDGAKSGEGPAQPGIYAFDLPNGQAGQMVLHADGRYAQMVDNQPRPIEEGVWRRREGQFCLEKTGGTGEACFAERAVGTGGDFSLTVADAPPIVFTQRAVAP